MNKHELPELPKPAYVGGVYHHVAIEPAYTADQMREYALAAQVRPCCGEYETCEKPCVPRGIELGKKEALAAMQAGEPVAWLRFLNGRIDWSEDCLYPTHDLDGYFDDPESGYELRAVFTRPQATSEAEAMLAFVLANRLYVGWNREGDACQLWKKGNPEDADEGCVAEDIRLPGSFDNEFDAIRAAMKASS